MASLLDGETAIVTGAGRGIGRGIAIELAKHGCSVVINDIDAESATETATEITDSYGVDALALPGDVSDDADAQELIKQTVDEFGSIDAMVNNAAIISPQAYEDIDLDTWNTVIDVNLTGVQNCSVAAFREMKASGGGKIVNIASIAGMRVSLLAGAHYTTSKWGVIGLTRHIAQEGGAYGIRANAVCPGPTESQRIEELTDAEQRAKSAEEDIPLDRWGTPGDVGKATVFFASELSAYVTGAALPVDGGFTIL